MSACFEGDNHKSSNVYDLTKKGLVTKKKWSCSIVISSYQNFSKIDDYNMRIFRGGVLAVTAAFTKRLLIRKSLQAKRPPCLCKLSCSIFLGTIFEYMLSISTFFCENFFIRYLASSPEYLREKRQNASDRWMWCGWLENKTRHYWSLSKVQHVCLALQQPWTFSNCRWKYLEATARWPTPNSRESSYLIGEREKYSSTFVQSRLKMYIRYKANW